MNVNHKPTYKNRYKGIKGRFWDWLSDFVRLRDFIKYGTCISCGKRFLSWKESQAGHFIAASNSGFSLLFDPLNIHAECSGCNGFNPNHQITYREGLINRYGKQYVVDLEERYKKAHFGGVTMKEWNKREYENKLEELKPKVIDLICQLNT